MIELYVPKLYQDKYYELSVEIHEWLKALGRDRFEWKTMLTIQFNHDEDSLAFKLRFGV